MGEGGHHPGWAATQDLPFVLRLVWRQTPSRDGSSSQPPFVRNKTHTHTPAHLPLTTPTTSTEARCTVCGGDPGAEAHPPSSAQPGVVGTSPACALLGQQRTSEDPLPSVPAGRMTTPGFGGLLFYCVGVWFAFLPPSLVDGPLSKRPGRGGGRRKGWCRPPPDSKAGVKSCTKA